jgi:hypothetical protein
MSVVDAILGRGLTEDDVPPVMASRPRTAATARREPPEDEEEEELKKKAAKARSSSVVAGILGMSESDEEGIIPPEAKPFDTFTTQQIPGMKEAPKLEGSTPSEPSVANSHGEQLIPPTAALVAPDVTPNVLALIDPSQVPAPPAPPVPPAPVERPAPPTGAVPPQPALDTILGRQNPAAEVQPPPGTVESFQAAINPAASPVMAKIKIAEALTPASAGGGDMPAHQEGDGKTIYNAFRQFNR